MTPAARIQAAIDILDKVLAGALVDPYLAGWGRANRYAGSGDRAAIRDYVYQALRRRASAGHLGGGDNGRAIMLGLLRQQNAPIADIFSGTGFAPAPLSPQERQAAPAPTILTALDCPIWLAGPLQSSLGDDFAPVLNALRDRASVFMRVNQSKSDVATSIALLERDGIAATPGPLSPFCLKVLTGERRISQSRAFKTGLVELQDAASQAVIGLVPEGGDILDLCAGGGGKSLALAARQSGEIYATDINPDRMRDLATRAKRANAKITRLDYKTPVPAQFDTVLIDAPCSGSGAWRRAPQGKWTLNPAGLDQLQKAQRAALERGWSLLRPGGHLIYATCSLLRSENDDQIAWFTAHQPQSILEDSRHWSPLEGGDGFFAARIKRKNGFN